MTAVHPVLDAEDERAFFDLRQRALAALPQWKPAPRAWETRLFDPRRNPLFQHIELQRYLAVDDDEVVGRIAAWVDDRRDDLGFFGFFDVLDANAGRALAWAARDWCAAKGRRRMRGPIDFWCVCSAGAPTRGFELANTFALHHGGPQYAEGLELAGLRPSAKLYAWQFGEADVPPPALGIARATMANAAIDVRPFDATRDEHWRIVEQLYTRCYVDGDWFTPMTVAELRLIADGYVEPSMSFLVFVEDEPAAMSVGLRNVVESSVRVGDFIPPEQIQRVLRPARRPTAYRQWLFAIAPPYRGRALGHLGTALYVELRERMAAASLERGEAAWTAATDSRLGAAFASVGARRDKTYRVFESTMAPPNEV